MTDTASTPPLASEMEAAPPAQHLPLEEMVPTKKVGRFHHGDLRLSLLAAAARALAARGDADISLRELARELGVTHAAAYRHFSAKSDLLAALATRGWVRLGEVAAAVTATAEGDDAPEQLRRFGVAYVAFARANPGPYHAMHLGELRRGRDFPALDVAVDHLVLVVANLINDGQSAGTVRRDAAAQDLAAALLAALDGAARAALLRPDDHAVADWLMETLVTGLRVAGPRDVEALSRRAAPIPAPAAGDKRERRKADREAMTLDLFG